MVLLTQLVGLASFGYTGWQIAGKWFTFRAKNENRQDDQSLFQALEDAINAAKSDAKVSRKEDFGVSAIRSGHAHLFDDFKKLPVPLRIQLIEDLTRVAVWSGQSTKVRRSSRMGNGCMAYENSTVGATLKACISYWF